MSKFELSVSPQLQLVHARTKAGADVVPGVSFLVEDPSRHQALALVERLLGQVAKAQAAEIPRGEQIPCPLVGEWKFENGDLCCGTFRVASAAFESNPSVEFENEVFQWICEVLNARQTYDSLVKRMRASDRPSTKTTTITINGFTFGYSRPHIGYGDVLALLTGRRTPELRQRSVIYRFKEDGWAGVMHPGDVPIEAQDGMSFTVQIAEGEQNWVLENYNVRGRDGKFYALWSRRHREGFVCYNVSHSPHVPPTGTGNYRSLEALLKMTGIGVPDESQKTRTD